MELSDSEETTSDSDESSAVNSGDREGGHVHDSVKPRNHLRPRRKPKSLPEFVSKWKRKHVAKLNIFYDKNYLKSPLDVLLKKGQIDEFSEMQTQYMDKVKSYLHFDALYVKNEQIHHKVGYGAFYSAFLKPLLDDIRRSTKPSKNANKGSKTSGSTSREDYVNVMAKIYVDDFIKELSVLLKTTHEYIKDSKTDLVEEMYSELFHSFVTMCHLKPRVGDAAPCYWHSLLGVDVSSKPDFRLCKKGMSFEDDEDLASVVSTAGVSLVQIQKHTQHKEHEELLKKKRKVTGFTCSTESSSTDDSSNYFPTRATGINQHSYIPEIELDLNEEVLWQHAGELLLDMRKYSTSNNIMPGMIINGTKVFFTMLEMTAVHLHKLIYNMELDKDQDIATIYYSKPLDILVEEDRNVLIENFMRLNNFHAGE